MVHFRLTLILVASIVLYTAPAQEADTLDEKGTVHGYITDTTPAQLPIVGVRVQIDNKSGHTFETTSAETGEFIYRDIPAGDYLVNIHKSGYQSRVGKPVSVTNGGVHYVPLTMNKRENIFTEFRNWFISKEPQPGTLQFRITTQSPQPAPIEDAEVKISLLEGEDRSANNIEITGTSDANGQYRRDNLPSGLYFVTVSNHNNAHNHVFFSMTVQGNRMTTASVKFPIPDETPDTDILNAQKTDTKWIIRGKIFDTNFQRMPVSDVEVTIRGPDLKQPIDALSDVDGEYTFVGPPGHYVIFLKKAGYEKTIISLSEITAENRQSHVTVIKEGMFVVYEAVAKGNVFALKHGISKEQMPFLEKYGDTIRDALLAVIVSAILTYFLNKFLRKHRQE